MSAPQMDKLEQDLARRLHMYVHELGHEPADILAQTIRLMIDVAILEAERPTADPICSPKES